MRDASGVPEDLTYSWVFGRGIERSILDPHPVGAWFLSDLIRLALVLGHRHAGEA